MSCESDFGNYIKTHRLQKGLGVNQLAHYSGVSAAQISRIETGKRGVPKPDTIKKLSKALKVDYAELMKVAGYDIEDGSSPINSAYHDFDNLTDEEKEFLETQLEIFRKYKEGKNK